jgi:hypothetical protein
MAASLPEASGMRKCWFLLRPLLLAAALGDTCAAAGPSTAAPPPDYMRFAEDRESSRLEIAVRSFTLPSGQRVDLIGVVHVADESYYQALNRRFDGYDAVLFELVGDPKRLTETAPEVLKEELPRSNQGAITTIQQAMSKYLKLTYQLGAIDYTKKNMVHADASAAEFARMQRERGENMATLFIRAMDAQMSGGPHSAGMHELNTFALIRIFMSPDSASEFKKALAKVFDQAESLTAAMEGTSGSAILSGRNDVAVKKLQEVLANRRQRRVAVFYGSGHMPGIETSLVRDLQAKPAGEEWLAAWTMPRNKPATKPPADTTPAPGTATPAS